MGPRIPFRSYPFQKIFSSRLLYNLTGLLSRFGKATNIGNSLDSKDSLEILTEKKFWLL